MAEKVFDLLDEMIIQPNAITLTIIFNTCAQVNNDRARKIGNKLLNQMLNNFPNDTILLTSAIHMLMSFGDVKSAEQLFESIKKKDVVSYGAMMKGYNLNNDPLRCLKLLKEMKQQGVIPNEIIFILAIGACSQICMLSICESIVAQIPSYLFNNQRISNALIDMWASIDCYKCLNFDSISTSIP